MPADIAEHNKWHAPRLGAAARLDLLAGRGGRQLLAMAQRAAQRPLHHAPMPPLERDDGRPAGQGPVILQSAALRGVRWQGIVRRAQGRGTLPFVAAGAAQQALGTTAPGLCTGRTLSRPQ